MTSTPSVSALASFVPGFSPATTNAVLPETLDPVAAAPLLCAGIIGYRALMAEAVPPGGRLGIYGFGGSAHLTAQVALRQGFRVHVLTRG